VCSLCEEVHDNHRSGGRCDNEVIESKLEDRLDAILDKVDDIIEVALDGLDEGRKVRLLADLIEVALVAGQTNDVQPGDVATYAMNRPVVLMKRTRRFALEIVKRALGHR
jgi:hypothetical protein